VDYLAGNLNFLFIAPERLRVPGFAEMLAKRRPSLIAIDEAHCISQWGHDFRPDYRMLGQHLPALRGSDESRDTRSPILALTATATPAVQADIVDQLQMVRPAHFIHGFRRDNLAIEVMEIPTPQRAGVICGLLGDPLRRPAIVYAQSRKLAESLAAELANPQRKGAIAAAAYHAGMEPILRDEVQTAFQHGKLDVVVATIAFGMGIDKANIRTVIHAGLPATLEGYYQEIGRAGRDGNPSRAILMHSYADQRMQDFFLTRDYPPVADLEAVAKTLDEVARPIEELQQDSSLSLESYGKALEKLAIHGGAQVDFNGNAMAGKAKWKKTYGVQVLYRQEQIEKVRQYTEAQECRMCLLVKHFGDDEDAREPCGCCDACDPAGAVLRQFRRATTEERTHAMMILDALRDVNYKATGTLQRELGLAERISRTAYDELLNAMVRAKLIAIEEAEYEKDGDVRRYRKASLAEHGLSLHGTHFELLMSDGVVDGLRSANEPEKRKKATGKSELFKSAVKTATKPKIIDSPNKLPLSAESEAIAERLRAWRTSEAKRLRIPPYLILLDNKLREIAQLQPKNLRQLEELAVLSSTKIERYGEAILLHCSK
jgi:superfamily II DNA helicase RecQ